jgi:hypothetical protein
VRQQCEDAYGHGVRGLCESAGDGSGGMREAVGRGRVRQLCGGVRGCVMQRCVHACHGGAGACATSGRRYVRRSRWRSIHACGRCAETLTPAVRGRVRQKCGGVCDGGAGDACKGGGGTRVAAGRGTHAVRRRVRQQRSQRTRATAGRMRRACEELRRAVRHPRSGAMGQSLNPQRQRTHAPHDGSHRQAHEGHHHGVDHGAGAHHAAVEERERRHHQKHKRAAR